MKHYKTSEIARLFAIHPNTVRLYEEWGLLPPVSRTPSGYRLFTQAHVDQIRLIRMVFKCTMFGRGIKKTAYQIIHLASEGNFWSALENALHLQNLIDTEGHQAEEAERFLEAWASRAAAEAEGQTGPLPNQFTEESTQSTAASESVQTIGFREAAAALSITPDMLRDWERNNLIHIPRNPVNGYREYGSTEINKLRVIRVLRRSNYSNMSILRAMQKLDAGTAEGLREALDSPELDADRGYLCFTDNLLTALAAAKEAVSQIIVQLKKNI